MRAISRRQCLKLLAASGVSVASYVPAHALGANEKIRIAIVGMGGLGSSVHVRAYTEDPAQPGGWGLPQRDAHIHRYTGDLSRVEIAAVCDVDNRRTQALAKMLTKRYGSEVAGLQDARTLMDDPNIDVLSIATCNHWHALLGVWACQAGKHVYVEKPCSHTIAEGRKLIEAAAKYPVCVQHGTQRRNFSPWHQAAAAFRSGKYGKPLAVHAYTYRPRPGIGFRPEATPPAALDWNLWVGPANETPYHANLQPYNWHWFWNTGNGEIGNTGVHYLDLCRMGLGDPQKHPANVCSFGARVVKDPGRDYKDQGETPTIQFAIYDYDGFPCLFEACSLECKNLPSCRTTLFHTDEGYLSDGKFYPKKGKEPIDLDFKEFTPPNPGGWFGNFLNCVRDNTPEKLNAPMTVAHYSTALVHLANISERLGRPAKWDECVAAMGDNAILQERMEVVRKNMQEFLPTLDVKKDMAFQLGETLTLDNATETFPGNDRANALLSKAGRAPFLMPETV
ncbi:MAG: Gfo/Idh/MocA family oxidoreductase [Planctomycetia bacterium]|nr:Gfo/Idh/MocA family oxidoreductase [Planctomycetia bacterium]